MENVYLHHIEANLISKQHSNLYQNRSSFVKDITNKYFGLFFSGHIVVKYRHFSILLFSAYPSPSE